MTSPPVLLTLTNVSRVFSSPDFVLLNVGSRKEGERKCNTLEGF